MARRLYGKDPEPEPAHDYSSIQVQITGRPQEILRKLARDVSDRDLAPDGRENDQHITCRWGLHFQTPSVRIRNALRSFGPISAIFGKTALFTGDVDVLKVDVESPDLHRLYKMIGRLAPTHTTHPTYKPHATLAYLKPGTGKKYTGNSALAGTKMTFDSVTFSGKKGKRETIPLNADPAYRIL